MKFSKFSQYLKKLEETPSLLEMTRVLAALFEEVTSAEVRPVAYLSLGEMAPLYEALRFNLAGKMMARVASKVSGKDESRVTKLFNKVGDWGTVIEGLAGCGQKKDLDVAEVYEELRKVAEDAGAGSQERKVTSLTNLLLSLDPLSARYVTRIVLGKLRLGFGDKTMLDSLSWMRAGDKSLRGSLERAYNVCPDIGLIAQVFKEKGPQGSAAIKIALGRPLLPQRCQRAKNVAEVLERMGGKTATEPKFDGERVQLHLDRNQQTSPLQARGGQSALELAGFSAPQFFIKAFTRNLDDVSHMFPDILEAAAKQLEAESVILDGEAMGFDAQTGEFVPFQVTATRKRKYGVGEKAQEVPLKFFVFDILYKDGESLLGRSFAERRKIMERVVGEGETVKLTPQKIITSAEAGERYLQKTLDEGLEGLVFKNLDSEYEAGGRGFSWIKLKGEKETVDAAILGYYVGEGRRAKFGIGGILVGVYDEELDMFRTISKVGSGLTDEQFLEMRRRCDELRVEKAPAQVDVPKELAPDVWITPSMVVSIRADEISKSPLHSSSYALRFPRLVGFREDKAAEDATTVAEIQSLYELQ